MLWVLMKAFLHASAAKKTKKVKRFQISHFYWSFSSDFVAVKELIYWHEISDKKKKKKKKWQKLTVPWVWPDARRGQKWEVRPPPDTTPWSYLSPGPWPVPETRCRARTHRSSGARTPPCLQARWSEGENEAKNFYICAVSANSR